MRHAAILATAILLAACAERAAPPPAPTDTATTSADTACLRDVAAATRNTAVRVVSTTAAPTETEVIVGVGPTGQWRCTALPDGTTTGLASITDEGAL